MSKSNSGNSANDRNDSSSSSSDDDRGGCRCSENTTCDQCKMSEWRNQTGQTERPVDINS
ncbi:MAG: hypothetical protein K2W82_16965 [Candidatus Obscuribacterales bacterium]|nr:hypothetical protein [Candidatus Obscuribacterales bacterium]